MPINEKRKHIGPYEWLALITGFALLSFELVASRILAPAIGSSIYVWTSVIGVIIAALAVGYTFGGKIADKRVKPLDIVWLLIGSSAAVTLTMLGSPFVLDAVLQISSDPRFQGMLASIILFAPASFLLGAIGPYLGRLKNVSVTTTGTTIASLSSLNAIGSILGTFCTGFLFFSYLGSRATLLLVIVLLLGSSWLIEPRQFLRRRLVAVAIVVLVSSAALAVKPADALTVIDTPSASYKISDIMYRDRPVRVLMAGPGGLQSGIYLDGSPELVFDYTRKMADIVSAAPVKDSILILGGGAFTLPQYFAEKYPSASIDVVEIDPGLAPIARQYFGYKDPGNVQIVSQDARTFLNDSAKQYDIVLVDAYNDVSIPFTLTTNEYVEKLRRSLSADGLLAVNVIASSSGRCGQLLSSLHTAYSSQFDDFRAYPLEDSSLEIKQNVILVYGNRGLEGLPSGDQPLNLPRAPTLRDDFAPVEYLQAGC